MVAADSRCPIAARWARHLRGWHLAGIAHDFNKVLSAILGNATLAEHEQASDHPGRPRLAHIEPWQPDTTYAGRNAGRL